MSLAPVVRTVDLARERDPQISKMIDNMENSKPSHKRLFQKLPKHLRRRAMSYDIRKVPKSMRTGTIESQVNSAADAKAKNKPSGRDKMKYRPNSERLMSHRNREFRWLETHLWHAKRFHMGEMWGWKVPLAPTMKQTRNLIRMTADKCTMRDVSYYAVVSLSGEHLVLVSRVAEYTRPNANVDCGLHRLVDVELFEPFMFPVSPIGPVKLFWVKEDCLWIICHPILNGCVVEAFKRYFSPEVIDGELNMFEVLGPESTDVIRRVLHPTGENDPVVSATLGSLQAPGACPPGFSIAWTAHDPRTVADDVVLEKPSAAPVNVFEKELPAKLCASPLFTNRDIEFKSEAEFNEERSKLLFPKAEGPSGSVPVLMMQLMSVHAKGYGSGWLLITPFGTGKAVFRKLVHYGVRVFGIECARQIDLEAERFNFPYDRPDTNDGLLAFTQERMALEEHNDARPRGKQKDLRIYEFPPDFYISTDNEETAYLRVSILMAKRGTPSRFSTIYIPDKDDYQHYGQICEIKGSRRPIGLVLNGNNSLLAGDGKGLGLVRTQALLTFLVDAETEAGFSVKQRPKDSRLVLIREQGSQFLHMAWIWPHPSNFYP